MNRASFRRGFSKFLRTTVHLAIALNWLLVAGAYLPDLLKLPAFNTSSIAPTPDLQLQTNTETPRIIVLLAGIGAVLFISFVLYVIGKVYARGTDKVVEQMTESATREVLRTAQKRKHHLTKKQRRVYSRRTIFVVYAMIVLLPVLVLYVFRPIQTEILADMANLAVLLLALWSVTALAAVTQLVPSTK